MIRSTFAFLFLAGVFALAPTAASAQSTAPECDVDEQQKRIKYSLYFENYRAEAYEAALPDLEWILECAPAFGGPNPDDRNVRRAVEIHEALAERATDPAERTQHLERALELIQSAVSTIEADGGQADPYWWALREGRFLQTHEQTFAGQQGRVCEIYEGAYEMNPGEIDDFYLQVIAFCRAEDALTGDADARRGARSFLEETLIASASSDAAREYIQTQAERLITTPREEFAFIYERYQAEGAEGLSDDELERMFTLVSQAGADLLGSEEEARSIRRVLLPRVAQLNPTYGRIMSLGAAALADGDRNQAIQFFQQALPMAESGQQRRDIHYNLAVIRQQQGQTTNAANHVREALAIDGNHGPSLFMMGSLIQSGIRGDDIQSRAAYWCAADYFSRAASAGGAPGAGAAAARANSAAPSSDQYFFQGWRPGQTVTASYGWGSCQARVR
jgi:tetratricopeptide (TPR) repeat protein